MRNSADLIVLGGGIAGCLAAASAARRGISAALVERTGILAGELTDTGRASITQSSLRIKTPILPGAMRKKTLAERLADGQEPLFFSAPVGRLMKNGRAVGVLLANSYGMFLLSGAAVLDAQAVYPASLPREKYRYTFELAGVDSYFEAEYEVPEAFGGRIFVEDAFLEHRASVTFTGEGTDDAAIRLAAFDLFRWMRGNLAPFASAKLTRIANRIVRREDPLFAQDCPGWQSFRFNVPMDFSRDDQQAEEQRLIRVLDALLTDGKAVDEDFDTIELSDGTLIPRAACTFPDGIDDALPFRLTPVCFPQTLIRRREKTSALIAGAGTAGFTAFQAMAESGLRPLVLEQSELTGGTNVAGRVTGNWHGYCGGINEKRAEDVKKFAAEGTAGAVVSAELMQASGLCGYDYRPATIVCGAITDGNAVRGVIAADGRGLFAVEADVTVDATGDATVAYLAGLPTEFGFVRTGLTQTYSQFGEEYWSNDVFTKNRFQGDPDMLCQLRYSELLRGTYLGHRYNSDFDFSPYPTPRESRRIVGDYSLSMKEIFEERRHCDDVAVTSTPFDSHGMCENLFGNLDLCRCNHAEELRAHIPYRCYLPKDTEGLLVTAKCFSGSRDAVNVCRMNPDLRNAGYAVGLAAAMAVNGGVKLREIDVEQLRRKLFAAGVLPEWENDPEPEIDWTLPEKNTFNTARALLADPADAPAGTATQDTYEALLFRGWNGDEATLDDLAAKLASGELSKYVTVAALALLGKAARRKDVPALAGFLPRLSTGGPITHKETNYNRTRFDGWRYPNDKLLHTAFFACERLADGSFVAPLEALLETMKGLDCPDRLAVPTPFFGAYTELRLGSVLARCGSAAGVEVLSRYAKDARYTLRRYAEQELKEAQAQPGVRPRAELSEVDALY